MTKLQVFVITEKGNVIPFKFIPFRTRQEIAESIYNTVDKNHISYINGMLQFPVTEWGYPIYTNVKD